MSPFALTTPHPLASIFARQTIAQDAESTLSSWGSCMAKSYCKWPVIAVIIIGSVIALSLIICIARFCCCGIECCCWCCSCFNSCCPSPRKKQRGAYTEAPQYPPQSYGYAAPMSYGPPANYGFGTPQFATYESASKGAHGTVKEDSLPAMPSWEQSKTRHVEDTSYHGANAENTVATEFGRTQQDGIALGAVPTNNQKMRDDEPLYENPDDQTHPMLHGDQVSAHGGYAHPQSEYNEADNMYGHDSTSQFSDLPKGPQHPYDAYNQQSYGEIVEPRSPTSMYSNQRPPTYQSRAPSVNSYQQRQQPFQVRQQTSQFEPQPQTYQKEHPTYQRQQQAISTTSPPQRTYSPFSPTQSTQYEPSAAVPSVLSPNVGAPYQPYDTQPRQQTGTRYYELGGGDGSSKRYD